MSIARGILRPVPAAAARCALGLGLALACLQPVPAGAVERAAAQGQAGALDAPDTPAALAVARRLSAPVAHVLGYAGRIKAALVQMAHEHPDAQQF